MNIDDKLRRQCRRAEIALVASGIRSREQLLAHYDKHSRFTDIRGIGKVLGKALRRACDHLDIEQWYSVFSELRYDAQDTGPDTDTIGGTN